MKLIIEIPKDIYNDVKKHNYFDSYYKHDLLGSIDNGTPLEEEFEKIIDKIDFEEKWLINIKMENGFISIADIRIAMCRIGQAVSSELKGE